MRPPAPLDNALTAILVPFKSHPSPMRLAPPTHYCLALPFLPAHPCHASECRLRGQPHVRIRHIASPPQALASHTPNRLPVQTPHTMNQLTAWSLFVATRLLVLATHVATRLLARALPLARTHRQTGLPRYRTQTAARLIRALWLGCVPPVIPALLMSVFLRRIQYFRSEPHRLHRGSRGTRGTQARLARVPTPSRS